MRKYILLLAICFITTTTFVACDEDEPSGESLELNSYLTGTYAPDNEKYLLSASIDGKTVSTEASVTFRTGDFKTGSMTLDNVFEGYNSIEIDNLPLTEVTEDGYTRLTFSGNKTVNDTFSFNYSGYIAYGNLYIEITTH